MNASIMVKTAGNDSASAILSKLNEFGAVELPPLVSENILAEMQSTFGNRLKHMSLNNVEGYQRGELFRLTVHNPLTLAQGFVDIGLHPLAREVIQRYVGPRYGLCEAKGWQTQPTTTDFNTWHGDAWYDQATIRNEIPREVKLAFYLSDVKSGAFQYLSGTHRLRAPSVMTKSERNSIDPSKIIEFRGKAGTAILFDTSGIHRQGVPILEPRRAVFYNYHDREVALQEEDVAYYRYHPLILNAAFLGDLDEEHRRVLGFGFRGRFQADHVRSPRFPMLHRAFSASNVLALHLDGLKSRVGSRLRRAVGRT